MVQVGDQAITEGVIQETDRALRDHELIKVRVNNGEREDRNQACEALAKSCEAEIVQKIGKVAVLYRSNPKVLIHMWKKFPSLLISMLTGRRLPSDPQNPHINIDIKVYSKSSGSPHISIHYSRKKLAIVKSNTSLER